MMRGRWLWDSSKERWEWQCTDGEMLLPWDAAEQDIFNERGEARAGLVLDEGGWAVPLEKRRIGF